MQACALRKRGRQPDAPEQRASVLCPEISKTLSLEDVLIDAVFQIAGVAGKLEKALALIESGACVDANLAGVSASPAASALAVSNRNYIIDTLSNLLLDRESVAQKWRRSQNGRRNPKLGGAKEHC